MDQEGSEAELQRQLWQQLYSDSRPWSYPSRWMDDLDFTHCTVPTGTQLHLFCLNSLCQLHRRLLERFAAHCHVHLYLLSPCHLFWADQLTGRERRRLNVYWQRRGVSPTEQQRLVELLNDTNPLLAQWGRLGRILATGLDEIQTLSGTESYQVAAGVAQHPAYAELLGEDAVQATGEEQMCTLLQAIQADLLLLRNPQGSDPIALPNDDDSIQCHIAPSAAREVQVIYEQLLHLLDRHANDPAPITAGDVLILATDLRRYAPLLQTIFGRLGSRLSLRLNDIPLIDHSPFIQSFVALLRLALGRWEAPALLEFLGSPFVQKRHQLTSTDLVRLRGWVRHLPIYWGQDSTHRMTLLNEAHCLGEQIDDGSTGTWQQGLHALLLQLARPDIDSVTVEFSDAQLISTCLTLIQSLADDLRPLRDGTKMQAFEWSSYLQCLCQAYLMPTDGASDAHRELLFAHLETLGRADSTLCNPAWEFASILSRLEAMLGSHLIPINEADLDTVQVCALQSQRMSPARIIVLLGMNEGAFPRSGAKSPFDLCQGDHTTSDVFLSDADQDRYLFLECVLSARQYLLISSSQTSAEDGREQRPSLPVEELLAYIHSHYTSDETPKTVTRYHPFHAFDPCYFKEKASLHNSSMRDYHAALAYVRTYLPESELSIPAVCKKPSEWLETNGILELRDLETAVRDPIKLYLNQTLGIYLSTENPREVKAAEPLVLSMRQRYGMRASALREPVESLLGRAVCHRQMPRSLFGAVANEQLREDLQPMLALQNSVQGLQMLPCIELSIHCSQPRIVSPELWQFPAINIGKVSIIGVLDKISTQGLFFDGDGSFADAVRTWPSLLAFHRILPYLQQFCAKTPEAALLFMQKGRTKKSFVHDPTPFLEALVTYYQRCLQRPSLLHADWARQFLSATDAGIAAFIEKELRGKTSRFRHLNWLLRSPSREQLLPMVSPWVADAKALYQPLLTHWYTTENTDAVF